MDFLILNYVNSRVDDKRFRVVEMKIVKILSTTDIHFNLKVAL